MRIPRAVGAVCATLGLALTACASEISDPRAYSGTYDSLDRILESYELALPSCEVEDLRFTGRPKETGKHLYLRFEAPGACVESYLDTHGVDRAHPYPWPSKPGFTVDGKEVLSPTAPPFPEEAMKKFDLKLDPETTYDRYMDFRTESGAEFAVLLVPEDGDRQAVYMTSTYNGED